MGDSSRLSGDVFERLGTRTSVWLGDLGVHEQTNIGVIDDEFEMPAFPDRLVRTRKLHGLCAGDLPAVLGLLAGA